MQRHPRLTKEQAEHLYHRLYDEGLTLAQLARETGRNKSALYRLFNRRFGYRAGHSSTAGWSRTVVMPSEIELAYIAGLFDGEGNVSFRKDGHITLRVGMTEESVIRWLATFCGTVYGPYHPTGNRKPTWQWTVARKRDVLALAQALLPLSRVKAEQLDRAVAALSERLDPDTSQGISHQPSA